MDNTIMTSSSQMSPNLGNPLNPRPIPPPAPEAAASTATIESIVSTPLEPDSMSNVDLVGQTNADGNVQGHLDVNYQPHDVALATAKANGHPTNTGFTVTEKQQHVIIDDADEHPEKSPSCCSMLNKLFLALAAVCFALFLCSMAYIVANFERLNGDHSGRRLSRISYSPYAGDELNTSERLVQVPYFNITHRDNGMIVTLSRRGASIKDILIPIVGKDGSSTYRSVVIKGGEKDSFGSVRFGFENPSNPMDMTYQLPADYKFLNYHQQDWEMYADVERPHRACFINRLVQIVYEFSPKEPSEFTMTTIAVADSSQPITVDPTNNIYFDFRGDGNLSTHTLLLAESTAYNIDSDSKSELHPLEESSPVDRLSSASNYFYELKNAGIGKTYIAKLHESESKITMHLFSNHAGVIVDPSRHGSLTPGSQHASAVPRMYGIRISPRQSPKYDKLWMYGRRAVSYPSQAIHTTWWQFDIEK